MGVFALSAIGILFFVTAISPDNTIASFSLMFCYFFMPANGINGFSTCVDIGGGKACTIAGIMNFAGNMGAFFLAVVFGKIADMTHSFTMPMFIIAGVSLIGSILWLSVDPTKKIFSTEREKQMILQYQ